MFKIGFTGTRGENDAGGGMTKVQESSFYRLIKSKTFNEFHHGDCIGSDKQAHEMVKRYRKNTKQSVKLIGHPPRYNKFRAYCDFDMEHKTHEYLRRNHYIVEDTDILIATPLGPEELRSGTWSTIRYARQINRTIYIIDPDGKVEKE